MSYTMNSITWMKAFNNIKDFNTWARRINKQLEKEWYKIPSTAYANLRRIDWKVVTELVKIEKKISNKPLQNIMTTLNLVDKWVKSITRKEFSKIAKLTWKVLLWEKRIYEYTKNEDDPNLENFWKSKTFKDFLSEMNELYLKENKNKINYINNLNLLEKEKRFLEDAYLKYPWEDSWMGNNEYEIHNNLLEKYWENFFEWIEKWIKSIE